MTTKQKVDAILAAIKEHAELYKALKTAGIPEGYDELVVFALKQSLTGKIDAIYKGN